MTLWQGPRLMSPERTPLPDSPYGQSKYDMETLGRNIAARRELEVVCVRFGGINAANKPPKEPVRRRRWLSNEDCVSLVLAAIDADTVVNNFTVVYAVSDNPGRIHDISNPFGWTPKSAAVE